jgi:hypothetical protein
VRKKLHIGLLLLCYFGTFLALGADVADDRLGLVKEAITRSICREVFWEGAQFRLGRSLPLEVKFEGKKFYVWIVDLTDAKNIRTSYFYEGLIKDRKAIVIFVTGHNMASKRSPTPQLLAERRKFEDGAIKEKFTTPTHCFLDIDPLTPEKTRMIETVVSTMQKQLGAYRRQGIESYPSEVSIIIADFNVDYPYTYVLVNKPGSSELDVVTLHDYDDWESDKYERDGAYPLVNRRIGPEHKELLAKIQKNGIARKIIITP